MATFAMNIPGDVSAALDRAAAMLTNHGGRFQGDLEAGIFTGSTPFGEIAGTYTVRGQTVTIAITKKPLFLPERLIEATIRGFFTESMAG